MSQPAIVSIEEAVSHVKSNDRVFLQGAAMTPNSLITKLSERYEEAEAHRRFHAI